MAINENLTVENAHLIYRNFSGAPSQFNREGDRNFCVRFDVDTAQKLADDGWNIKFREPREEGDEPFGYLPVAVNYNNFAPNIWLVTSHNKTRLDANTVSQLDYAEIQNVDLVIRPYNWEVSGKKGTKAYVKNMYVTIVEDDFADKYADIPDGSAN